MSPEHAANNGSKKHKATGTVTPTSGSPSARRSLWTALAVLGAVLVVAIVVALVWRGGEGFLGAGETTGTESPAPANTPDATSAPTPDPTGTPATPEPTTAPPPPGQAAAPGVPRPSSCTELYGPEMVEALGDLALNPAWTQDADSGVFHGTGDTELQTQIDTLDHLTCVWASPYGGSGTGIITNVVWVTPEQSAAVEARLAADGLECSAQSEGRRCVIETVTMDGAFGESHFLRNGLWLATKYTNGCPPGYTQDIIDNLWMVA